jgi:hypothetical protein
MDPELSGYAALFIKYAYVETKDLGTQFLTVVISVLVFSLAFSEKIVRFSDARFLQKMLMISAWCLMMAAIIAGGIGVVYNAMAGAEALYQREFAHSAHTAVIWLLIGGGCFFLGLIALIGAAIGSIWRRPADAA